PDPADRQLRSRRALRLGLLRLVRRRGRRHQDAAPHARERGRRVPPPGGLHGVLAPGPRRGAVERPHHPSMTQTLPTAEPRRRSVPARRRLLALGAATVLLVLAVAASLALGARDVPLGTVVEALTARVP